MPKMTDSEFERFKDLAKIMVTTPKPKKRKTKKKSQTLRKTPRSK
jgi:hypothetical protein